MTAALDPHSAIGYLRLLSCDLVALGVRGGGGQMLAGVPLDGTPGTLVSVSSERLTVDAKVGPHALSQLLEYDLQVALGELSK